MGEHVEEIISRRCKTAEFICGFKEICEPSIIKFRFADEGRELLERVIHKARANNSNQINVLIHADVDLDGVSSAYIMYRWLSCYFSEQKVACFINIDRVHGICDKHVDVVNNSKCDLLVIVDSSSNDIEYIKNMTCDVLVIDHHNVKIEDFNLIGNTANGTHVLINNMIEGNNELYNMSGAQVVYEFLRYVQSCWGNFDGLKSNKLYQWVAMSLFSDMIDTDNLRNQWYLEKAFDVRGGTEVNLGGIIESLNKFQKGIDKSFINFTLASLVNASIRNRDGVRVLNTVIMHPEKAFLLLENKERQQKLIDAEMKDIEYSRVGKCIIRDMSGRSLGKGYFGLLANKIMTETRTSTMVYLVDGNMAKGSFRGLDNTTNYYDKVNSIEGCRADGHDCAFGFEIPIDKLNEVALVITADDKTEKQEYITIGPMFDKDKGIYHFDNMQDLRKNGLLMKISMVNSRVLSSQEISVVCNNCEGIVDFVERKGDIWYYNVLGMSCKAFEEITTSKVRIYVEYRKEFEAYLRKVI